MLKANVLCLCWQKIPLKIVEHTFETIFKLGHGESKSDRAWIICFNESDSAEVQFPRGYAKDIFMFNATYNCDRVH